MVPFQEHYSDEGVPIYFARLSDGFQLHFNEKFIDGKHVFQNVRIEFR